jgi:hypothetical protein
MWSIEGANPMTPTEPGLLYLNHKIAAQAGILADGIVELAHGDRVFRAKVKISHVNMQFVGGPRDGDVHGLGCRNFIQCYGKNRWAVYRIDTQYQLVFQGWETTKAKAEAKLFSLKSALCAHQHKPVVGTKRPRLFKGIEEHS